MAIVCDLNFIEQDLECILALLDGYQIKIKREGLARLGMLDEYFCARYQEFFDKSGFSILGEKGVLFSIVSVANCFCLFLSLSNCQLSIGFCSSIPNGLMRLPHRILVTFKSVECTDCIDSACALVSDVRARIDKMKLILDLNNMLASTCFYFKTQEIRFFLICEDRSF